MEVKKSIWHDAGVAGLVLGGVSIAYFVVSYLLALIDSNNAGLLVLGGVLSVLLWIAKLVGCILLMRYFMRKYSPTFGFGTRAALLSSLVYSAFYLAAMLFITPDFTGNAIEVLRENPMMDQASLEMLEEMAPKMPTIMFFTNLFYCWFFGTILAAIISRNNAYGNPFSGEEQADCEDSYDNRQIRTEDSSDDEKSEDR